MLAPPFSHEAALDSAKKSELVGIEGFKGLVEHYLEIKIVDMHALRMSHFFHCLTIMSSQSFPLGDRIGHCLYCVSCLFQSPIPPLLPLSA